VVHPTGGSAASRSMFQGAQFTGGTGIMQVEHTADCFGGAWFKSPLSTEV